MSSQQSRQQELVYCHACGEEWYRHEHGLECPRCHSDVVEVIEEDHDPRVPEPLTAEDIASMAWHGGGRSPPTSEDIATHSIPDGRALHERPVPPPPDGNGRVYSMLSGLLQNIGRMNPGEAMREGQFGNIHARYPTSQYPNNRAAVPPVPHDTRPDFFQSQRSRPEGASVRVHQFGPIEVQSYRQTWTVADGQMRPISHTTTQRLGAGGETPMRGGPFLPHDPDMMGMLGEMFGGTRTMQGASRSGSGVQHFNFQFNMRGGGGATAGGSGGNAGAEFAGSPLAAMLEALGLGTGPSTGRAGDYILTPEALDRFISQMMTQNQQSNAPGPASETAITALPRVKVDRRMVGEEGNSAECGICLVDCEIGEEVTELPCKHWFHYDCVKHWLESHDSCPSCRRGIMPREGDEDRPRTTGEAPRNWQMPNMSRSNTHDSQTEQSGSRRGSRSSNPASPQHGPASNSAQESFTFPQYPSVSSSAQDGGHPSAPGRDQARGFSSSAGPSSPSSANRGEGFAQSLVDWMGRHFSGSSPHGSSREAGSSTQAHPPDSPSNSRQRSPRTRRDSHMNLDNPEID